MAEMYDVAIKVVSQKGTCGLGHKVGDEWVISHKTPEGLCMGALGALHPYIMALMCGGTFSWTSDPYVATFACPDAENPVVLELRRLQK